MMRSEKWLENKTIVIIGGTTGLGLSAAKAFVVQGAKVVVVGRNPESCQEVQKLLGLSVCMALQGDATQPNTTPKAIENALGRFGSFDGLYHVAGGSGRKYGDS